MYHNIFVCFTQKRSIVANGWNIILYLMDLWTDAYQNIVGMRVTNIWPQFCSLMP